MNEERLNKLKTELKTNILVMKCDVSKEEEVKAAIDKTVQEYGTIHVSLASAGILGGSMMLTSKGSINTDHFRKMFAINVFGSVYVAKYATMVMAKNEPFGEFKERGVLLFVSSVAAEEGQRG